MGSGLRFAILKHHDADATAHQRRRQRTSSSVFGLKILIRDAITFAFIQWINGSVSESFVAKSKNRRPDPGLTDLPVLFEGIFLNVGRTRRCRVLRNSTPNSLFEQRLWQHCAESLPR